MTLNDVLQRELVRMLARNLEGCPAASEIGFSVSVYEDDLRSRGLTDADSERLKAAFEALGPTVHRFPTPADILAALPRNHSRALPPGRSGYGIVNREGQRKFIDVARDALEHTNQQEKSYD